MKCFRETAKYTHKIPTSRKEEIRMPIKETSL
jgi:hypothetical protein